MGIASSLFHAANDSEKQTLHRRITPTQEQFEEQQERWNALADYLTSELGEASGCAMRTWLQGSYKCATQVRPCRLGDEFDIDLSVYFQWGGNAEDGEHEPEELKGMVQRSLRGYATDDLIEVVTPPKPRCSRIRFKGGFHIDIPAYHLDPERDARKLATAEYGWEDSDPKALYLWFKDSFDDDLERAKTRRQIRYLKCWTCLKFDDGDGRPSSTLITVLVAEAFQTLADPRPVGDDEILPAIVEAVVDRLERNPRVRNPVNGAEVLTDRLGTDEFDAFLESLRELRGIAADALACDDILAAAEKWSEVFAHFFPLPDENEFQLAKQHGAQLPAIAIVPDVNVHAVSRSNVHARWEDVNKIGPIPKGCDIYFVVTNSEVIPGDAVVEWMVRNEGDEAENTNDLGHRAGFGLKAEERSKYKGIHYMDCVVKRYGRIIGMRRIPVEIHGMFMPRRNPANRPAYVRLRGRH